MSDISQYLDITGDGRAAEPHALNRAQWQQAVEQAAAEGLILLGLWGSRTSVTIALLDEARESAAGGAETGNTGAAPRMGLLSFSPRNGRFPSVGRHFPSAQRLERSIADLFGLLPEDAPDTRPWLDHGRWGVSHPLGKATADPAEAAGRAEDYPFLPVEGHGLHQVPVGPVHAGIIEPGHFRFTAQGETVVRLEERLGYVHKGIEGLMQGADTARGARLAARVSGDSAVAFGWAYAQAVEAALGAEVPARARWLRAIMAELERLANHLGDIGAICNDAAFAMMLAQCSALRERVLRAAGAVFGHRFMRDLILPGGVAVDPGADGLRALRALVDEIGQAFPRIRELYDNTPSLLDRTTGAGRLSCDLARRFGAGGHVGRASGRGFDARKAFPYGPYGGLRFSVPVRKDGDVNARIWIRILEVEQSLSLLAQLLDGLPEGAVRAELPKPAGACRGLGLVEGFRGDILAFVALDRRGRITRCHLRDPSWFQWPLLEAVIEGNIIADFPLCNKSFNCSYSGHDL